MGIMLLKTGLVVLLFILMKPCFDIARDIGDCATKRK